MPVPRMFYSQLANDGLNVSHRSLRYTCRRWMVGAVEAWGTTYPSLKFSRQLAGKVRPRSDEILEQHPVNCHSDNNASHTLLAVKLFNGTQNGNRLNLSTATNA